MLPGSLTFDDTGESVGPATRAADAQALRIFARSRLHLGGGQARLSLDRCLIRGRPFNITLHFEGPRLAHIDLFLLQSSDGQSWNDWTLENEMARKQAQEAWAAEAFGRPMEIEPYLMPEPVYPFNPGPDHPRHAVFDWGEVGSYYDSKGGQSSLRIRYGPP